MTRPKPSPEELALLRPEERRAYQLASLFAGPMNWYSRFYLGYLGSPFVWFCCCRRLKVVGAEHIADLGPEDRVLMVSNHRSFFDFFAIAHTVFFRSRASRRVFFPVRSSFFYESLVGTVINLATASMSMFPPILRDPERKGWNRFAVDRVLYELSRPGTLVGVHPEGKRGRGPDPYEFLPAQPGVGRMAVESDAKVVPFFILGMTNDLWGEIKANWLDPESRPMRLYIGPPVPLDDLRREESCRRTWFAAAERCMEHIGALADQQRADDEVGPPPLKQVAAR